MIIQNFFEIMNSRLLAKFKAVSLNPEQSQKNLLFQILRENQNCEYGLQHSFRDIDSVEEFQRRVPIAGYKDLEDRISRIKKGEQNLITSQDILYFATTSGSTNTPKFIPITKKRLNAFKEEYTLWAVFALRDHPELVKGKSLLLTGSNNDGITQGRIRHGSVSGYLASKLPGYVKSRLIVPFEVYNIKDFNEKMHAIAILGLEANVSQLALSSPIEVLLFLDYISQRREQLTGEIFNKGNKKRAKELEKLSEFKPKSYWPKLTLLNYIKGGFARFYLDRVQEIIGPDIAIRDPGIYSSEGRVSLCLSDEGIGGVIAASSNFFEFMEIKEDGLANPITLEYLEQGKKYSVLLTTQEGLYRYDLGDVIKVIDFYKRLPIVEFVDRREKGLSMTGEHVTESELVSSVKEASKKHNITLVSFTAIPNISENKPRYDFLVEPTISLDEATAKDLLQSIEEGLQTRNFVYRKMRQDYGRINPPVISLVKAGNFNRIDRERIQENGVKQLKPINLKQDPKYKERFEIEATYSI